MAEPDDDWNAPVEGLSEWDAPIGEEQAETTATPAAPTEFLPQAARLGKIAGHSLATGIANIAGIPGSIQNATMSKQTKNALTGNVPYFSPMEGMTSAMFPTAPELEEGTGLGMSQHPELKPKGWLEHGVSAVAKAIPDAALLTATGPFGMLGSGLIAGGSNIAADAAEHYFPDVPWAPIAAGVTTSLLTGAGLGMGAKYMAARAATKELAEAEGALEAARKAKFANEDPSGNTPTNALTGAKEAKVLSAEQIADANAKDIAASEARVSAAKNVAQAGQDITDVMAQHTFESTAKKLGKAATLEDTGAVAQKHGVNWVEKEMPKAEKVVRDALEKELPKATPTELGNFGKVVEALGNKAGILQNFASVLSKPQLKQLSSILESRTELAKDAVEKGAAIPPFIAPSGDVRALRSAVGEALADPSLAGNKDMQAVYKALTADIGATAEKQGEGAAKAWSAYNTEETRLHEFRDGTLSKLVSTKNDAKERIVGGPALKSLLAEAKDDGTHLALIRQNMPETANEIASYVLKKPGAWQELSPNAQKALIPDEATRVQLGKALEATETAKTNAGRMAADAQQAHKEIVDAAALDAKYGNRKASRAVWAAQKAKREADYAARAKVRAAQERIATAKGAIPPEPSASAVMKRVTASGVGAFLGNRLAPLVANTPGLGTGLEIAGLVIPPLYRGVKSLVARPGNAMIPAAGVLAGENALTKPRSVEITDVPGLRK